MLCPNENNVTLVLLFILDLLLWQYGLWSFQMGGTKLEIFLPKNQHTQRKLLVERLT